MSFSNNIAARGGLHGWITQGGAQGLTRPTSGRSLAGKIYLPVDPAPNPTARADAHNAEAVDSKLPKAEASSAAGNFPVDGTMGNSGVCRCGKIKQAAHCVCHSCWFSAPPELRQTLKFGELRARRAALRLLLELASGRRVLRELQAETHKSLKGNS